MGSTYRASSATSSNQQRRPDHNGDMRDVFLPGEQMKNFCHTVDKDDEAPMTLSTDSIPCSLTPGTTRHAEELEAVHRDHEQSATVEALPVKTIFSRPDSNGSDALPASFSFLPAKNKTRWISYHKQKQVSAPVTASMHCGFEMSNKQANHDQVEKSPPNCYLERQARDNEALSPLYQPDAVMSSVESAESLESRGNLDAETRGQECVQEKALKSEEVYISRRNERHKANPLLPQPQAPSCQATKAHTDHATYGNTLDEAPDYECASAQADEERQEVIEINTHAVEYHDMDHDEHQEEHPVTSAIAEVTQQDPPSKAVARKQRVPSPLIIPLHGLSPRVTKGPPKQHRQPSRSTASPTQDELSDENLLEILIVRHQQQRQQAKQNEAAAHKLEARIKTLKHSHDELKLEKAKVEDSLQKAVGAANHLSRKNEALQEQLENMDGRYRKLKEFARSISSDMKSLRQNADEEANVVSELRTELKMAPQTAHVAVSKAKSVIKGHAKEISALRIETNQVFDALREAQAESQKNKDRLKDQVQQNRRLETHIANLQIQQQRHDKAAKEGHEQIQASLSAIVNQFRSLEVLVKAGPKVSDALIECHKLIEGMSKREHASPADLSSVMDMIDVLDTTVSQGVEKLDGALRTPRVADSREMKKMLASLKKSVDLTAVKEQELRTVEIDRARLQQEVAGDKELIEELRRSCSNAEIHTKSFQKGAENMLEWSKVEQLKTSRHETSTGEEAERLRLKWTTAVSELTTTKQRVTELLNEKNGLITSLEEMQHSFEQEKTSRHRAEEEVRRGNEEYVQALDDVKSEFEAEVTERAETIRALQESVEAEKMQATTAKRELQDYKDKFFQVQDELNSHKTGQDSLQQKHDSLTAEFGDLLQQLQQFGKVTSQLEEAQQQNESAKIEIDRLKHDRTQLVENQQRLAALQTTIGNKDAELHLVRTKLRDSETIAKDVVVLKEQLRNCDDIRRELEQSRQQYASVEEQLKREQGRLGQVQEQLTALQQCVDEKDVELNATKTRLQKSEEMILEMHTLREQLRAAINKHTKLEVSFKTIEAEANKVPDLRDQVQQRVARVTDLESKLEAAIEMGRQADEVAKDNGNLTESLNKARARCATAEQQLEDQSKLMELLRQNEETIASLQKKDKDLDSLKQQFADCVKECERKDAEILAFNREVTRYREESQQLGNTWNHISQRMTPELLEELTEDIDLSQPSARVDQNVGQASEKQSTESGKPQRRVADRSGTMKPPSRVALRPPLRGSQPKSSGSTNLVPNSQFDTQDETLEFAEYGHSSSSLSDLESEDVLSEEEGSDNEGPNRGVEIEQNQGNFRMRVPISTQPRQSNDRPSTAQTDLFNVHTTGLSGATARSHSGRKNGSPDSLPGIHPAQSHPGLDSLPKTVAPSQLELSTGSGSHPKPDSQFSPRRLRDGTQLGGREVTPPMPKAGTNLSGVMHTPAPSRHRPLPNSAAKRTMDAEPESSQEPPKEKRLKRNPANLEFKQPGPKPTPATPARPSTSTGSRKHGGSIIGANAPAPSATKKSSKPARKGLKNDKYTERFTS